MPTLLSRLFGAVFAVPLVISKPILRFVEARKRKSGAYRLRPPSRPFDGSQPGGETRLKPASTAELRAMRDEMRRILDAEEAHRRVFRHLARFERKFSKSGLRAIEEVPVEQLRRALKDFEALVRNWSSPSLADLRSRMAVTLADRSSAASLWIADNSVSSTYRPRPESMAARLARNAGTAFRRSEQAEVADVGMSRFEAAGGEWHSTSAPA
ncbi:MAG: hypothetical protein M3Y55_04065 [Pseudomonadota bacterium]|nr:hypothetical protein [Pseudomonadota bacterium]